MEEDKLTENSSYHKRKKILLLLLSVVIFTQSMLGQEKATLKQIKILDGFRKSYFSPDGTKISLLQRNRITVADVSTGKKVCAAEVAPTSSDPFLFAAPFSPDGRTLAVGFSLYDRETKTSTLKIKLWDALSCREIKSLVDLKAFNGQNLSFSSDGQKLAAVANIPRVWDAATGQEIYQVSFPEKYYVQDTRISSDGRWLAGYAEIFKAPYTYGTFVIGDLQTKQQKELNTDRIKDFKFSADSSLLVTVNAHPKSFGWSDPVTVKVYETGSWKVVKEFEVTGERNYNFDISPDKKLLAIGGFGTFKVFSLETGRMLAEEYHYKRERKMDLLGAPGMISFVDHFEFSPDGTMLATGGGIGYIKLWKITR